MLQSLKSRLASLKKWLAEAIRKTAEIMKPEPYQPSLMEYIQVFQNLRKAGRADWGKTAKQTAGINDLKFAAQVQFFMQEAGISTLLDFDEFVGKQQESLTQLDGVGKAVRKKQTAIKHLETFQRLKPISDKSKQGLGFMRKQYAEKHQQELNDFAKAVRYIYTSNFFTALNDGAVSAAISFMRSLVLPTVCIIVMPMIWKLDGVWYSLVASEVLAFFVSFGFMIVKRKKYRYG